MRTCSNSVRLVAFAIAGLFLVAGTAYADECKQVHAQIISDPIFGCATSPIGLCTSGTIDGNQGLNGSTFFTGDSAAPGPPTAPNPAWTISYSGTLEITTAHGTLVTRDTGIFDQLTGVFSSFDVVDSVNSSGKFAGATGTLFIGGRLIDGRFVTTVITGELCLS